MSNEDRESRGFAIELRASDSGSPKLRGYAATFNTRSTDMGLGFTEVVAPGAFTKTLKEQDVKAYWNHNQDYVLGSTRAGTLRVTEDATGLLFECDPPESAAGFMESVRRGDVSEMSFGFRAIRDQWKEDRDAKVAVRTLLEVRLFEVSPVSLAAYPGTKVSLRAATQAKEITNSFAAPVLPDHVAAAQQGITGPVIHLADERRMRLEIALRKLQLTN